MGINKNKIILAAQKYIQKGQVDKAIAEYLKIVKDDPKDIKTWLRIGDLYAKKGAKQEAVATYLKVAEYYSEQGFFLKAIAVYKQILKLDPTLIQIHTKLADLYLQLGLTSDAMSEYEQIVQFYQKQGKADESIEIWKKMVELDPENIPIRIKLAEALSKIDRKDEAMEHLKITAEKLKESKRIDDYIKVCERILWHSGELPLMLELAILYTERGDYKRALAKLQQAFQKDPQNLEVLKLLAQVFRNIGQNVKALSVYKEMVRIAKSQGNEELLKEYYKNILELDPNDTEAKEYLGKTPDFKPMEEVEEAEEIEELEEIEEISQSEEIVLVEEPKGVRSSEVQRMFAEVEVFMKYGLSSKAIEHIFKILELDPNNIIAREKLKDIYLKEGFGDEAIEQLFYLVNLTKDVDKYKAIDYLNEILSIDPYNVQAESMLRELSGESKESFEGREEEIVVEEGGESENIEREGFQQEVMGQEESLLEEEVLFEGEFEEGEAKEEELFFGEEEEQQFSFVQEGLEQELEEEEILSFEKEFSEEVTTSLEPEEQAKEIVESFSNIVSEKQKEKGEEEERREAVEEQPLPKEIIDAIEEGLAEFEFFIQQGLEDEAMAVLKELYSKYSNKKYLTNRIQELKERGDVNIKSLIKKVEELSTSQENPSELFHLIEKFQEGVKKEVGADPQTHFDLGIGYKSMGLLDKAIEEFELAKADPTKEVSSYIMMGECYLELGDIGRAIESFKKGLYVKEKSSEEEITLYYELGNAYLMQEDFQEAFYYFNKVYKKDPEFRDVKSKLKVIQSYIVKNKIRLEESLHKEFDELIKKKKI